MPITADTTATQPPGLARRLAGLLSGGGVLAVSIVVMNIATYAFQMIAARLLGPEEYGGVASLMALLLVVGVFQLGLQATAARRVSAAPGQIGQIERSMLAVTNRTALVIGAAMLVLSPVVWKVLKLDDLWAPLFVAIAAVPITVLGGQQGILQGERRWGELSIVYLSFGAARLGLGTACLLIHRTETAAMIGVALGQFIPAIYGGWILRSRRPVDGVVEEHGVRPTAVETFHASVALLGFFVLSNTDIVIARNVMSNHRAGLYAGALILTKAVMFLPQFVVIIAFPSMSTKGESRTALLRGLTAVLITGVVSVLGAWLLSSIAMIFVGGHKYQAVEDRLWLFAVLGTLLATLQLLVYSVLARQHRASSILVWAGVAALICLGLLARTLTHLVVTVICVDAVLTVVLLAMSLYHLRGDTPTDEPSVPEASAA